MNGSNQFSSRQQIEQAAAALTTFAGQATMIDAIGDRLIAVLRSGGKVLACGNGGSAAEAMHLTEELVGRYQRARKPLAAISLSADPCAMSCIANDWEFEEVFARQVEALGRKGDALVVLTTSGKSPNILRALERARQGGLTTIGLLGARGSAAESLCDLAITPGAIATSRIQECHLVAIHALLERIDAALGN